MPTIDRRYGNMITLNYKLQLSELLNKFKNQVTECKTEINPLEFPSLSIWKAYNVFINDVFKAFPVNRNNPEYTIEIYDCMELFDFVINAKEPFDNNLKKVTEYCNRISNNFEKN